MKHTIVINESQLSIIRNLLQEGVLLDNGNTEEYGDSSKIGTSATVHDSERKPVPGKDVAGDEISKELTNQIYLGSPSSKITNLAK